MVIARRDLFFCGERVSYFVDVPGSASIVIMFTRTQANKLKNIVKPKLSKKITQNENSTIKNESSTTR